MDIIQEARKLAIAEIKKFGLPNIFHFEISEKKAVGLAERLKADKAIVQVGVCLMDLKLGEAFKKNMLSQHVEMSLKSAKQFLAKFNIDELSKQKFLIVLRRTMVVFRLNV